MAPEARRSATSVVGAGPLTARGRGESRRDLGRRGSSPTGGNLEARESEGCESEVRESEGSGSEGLESETQESERRESEGFEAECHESEEEV